MWFLNNFCLCFLSFAYFFIGVNAACTLSARDKVPLFIKNFGRRQIILPKTIRNIDLESGETIQAHCSSGISLKSDYTEYIKSAQGDNAIEFYCVGTTLSFMSLKDDSKKQTTERYVTYISCELDIQQLYESNEQLPNCQKYESYAIGIAPTEEHNILTASICYDLENLSVKYVNYLGYRPKYTFLEQESNAKIQLGNKITGFNKVFHFMSSKTFNITFEAIKSKNPFLQIYDFDYSSILQDSSIQNKLQEYENMFNIIWWRNLRLGNWKHYLQALQNHIKSTRYLIYTGISGVLTMPTFECNRQEELIIQSEDITLKAPAYIWSYMNSTEEEFVLIASNSPFLTAKNISTETQICKDICNEIDWLDKSLFGRTHLMPTMGLVYCCRVKDVANKLENFPANFQMPETTTTTQKTLKTSQPKPTIRAHSRPPPTTKR